MKKAITLSLCFIIVCYCILWSGCNNHSKEFESKLGSPDSTSSENSSTSNTQNNLNSTAATRITTSSSTVKTESKVTTTVSRPLGSSSTVKTEKKPEGGYITVPKPEDLSGWRSHPNDYKLIALTFDDAPAFDTAENNITRTIIDTLTEYDGKATIFVIGQNVEKTVMRF